MDIEWAKDGRSGELFIVQARPETVQSQRPRGVIEIYHRHEDAPVLVRGRSVGDRIGSGRVHVIASTDRLRDFRDGEVLGAENTDPDWEPIMKRASAIVTDHGGRTCHAAIVARELEIPAIVGAENATARLATGQAVTVSCAEGETGFVYEGELAFDVERIDVESMPRPRTRVMMNLGDPRESFRLSFLPNDGVGLARLEFIINSLVRVHPMALVHYDELDDPEARAQIDELTRGYADRKQYFVDRAPVPA